jgi:hypothetical protein
MIGSERRSGCQILAYFEKGSQRGIERAPASIEALINRVAEDNETNENKRNKRKEECIWFFT